MMGFKEKPPDAERGRFRCPLLSSVVAPRGEVPATLRQRASCLAEQRHALKDFFHIIVRHSEEAGAAASYSAKRMTRQRGDPVAVCRERRCSATHGGAGICTRASALRGQWRRARRT